MMHLNPYEGPGLTEEEVDEWKWWEVDGNMLVVAIIAMDSSSYDLFAFKSESVRVGGQPWNPCEDVHES